MRSTQIPLFTPETEWVMPEELKDLRGAKQIAIDLETNDPFLVTFPDPRSIKYGSLVSKSMAICLAPRKSFNS